MVHARDQPHPLDSASPDGLGLTADVDVVGVIHQIHAPLAMAAELSEQLQNGVSKSRHPIGIRLPTKALEQLERLASLDDEPAMVGIQSFCVTAKPWRILEDLSDDALGAFHLADMVVERGLESLQAMLKTSNPGWGARC